MGFYVTVHSTHTKENQSYKNISCRFFGDPNTVVAYIGDVIIFKDPDRIEIFTKPRLCKQCLKHASQPLASDITEHREECRCLVTNDPRCPAHNPPH